MRGSRGFSLAEMLFALLITSLAGLLVIGGIEVATRIFQDTLLKSQTQLVMKEYMSELRSGLLGAEMDSALRIVEYDPGNPDSIDPAFVHSGQNCAGFFKIVTNDGGDPVPGSDGKEWGVIVFQPALYDYTTNTADKEAPTGQRLPKPVPLISSRLSEAFPATMTYRYEGGKFYLTLSVRSSSLLSSGNHVELSVDEEVELTPTGK